LTQAVEWALGVRALAPDGGTSAATAGLRLDDALRGFLAEQGTKHVHKEQLWRLVGGSLRLRLTANSLAGLPHAAAANDHTRDALDQRAKLLARWYEQLAEHVGRPHRHAVAPLEAPELGGGAEGSAGWHQARYEIWVHEHLHHLDEHLADLVGPAMRVAEIRRRPWWR
jgi:hypothetical protein